MAISEEAAAGLSSGFRYAANVLANREKVALEERLLAQRMELQNQYEEQRQLRAEAREARRVSKENIVQDSNGNFVKRYTNPYGETIKEEPASQYEIDTIRNSQRKDALTLDSLEARNAADTFKLANLESDRARELEKDALDMDYRRAAIGAQQANATADLARARDYDRRAREEATPDMTKATNDLVKDYQNLWKGYTQGDQPVMTSQEIYDVARASIREAGIRGKDVGSTFQNALRIHADRKRNTGTSTAKGFSLDNGN